MRKWIIGGGIGALVIALVVVAVVVFQRPAEGEEGDEFQLHPEARIIDDPAEVTAYDYDTGDLDITTDVEVGDVLVAGVTPATPYGLMARVESIDSDGTVSTSQAALTDVIASTGGPITVEGAAVEVDVQPADDVTYTPNLTASGTFGPVVEKELAHTFTFGKKHTRGSVTTEVAGEVKVGATASLKVDVGLFSGLKELEAKVTPQSSASVELKIDREIFGVEHTFPVGSIGRTWVYMVGVVPVVMTSAMEVEIDTEWSVKAHARIETSASAHVDIGYRYKDGSGSAFVEPDAEVNPPALDGDGTKLAATLRAEIVGSLEAEFYKAVAIKGGTGPYAQVNLAASANLEKPVMECTWEAGLVGEVSTSAGIKALGLKEWEKGKDVSFPLMRERPCPGYVPPAIDPLEITPGNLADQVESQDWQVGRAATAVTAYASGGSSGAPTMSLEGDLPPGVTFTPGTDGSGRLEGTPSEAGTFGFVFVARAGDERAEVGVTVVVAPEQEPVEPLWAVATEGMAAPIGHPWSLPFPFADGRAPYTVELVGDLPDGLRFDVWQPDSYWFERSEDDDPTVAQVTTGGEIAGVATELGEWPVVVRATDADGTVVEVPYTVSITEVPPEGWPPPVL